MSGPRRVLVLGDVAVDVVARLEGALAVGSDAAAAIVQRPGGAGANVARWLARAGAAVTLVGRVGGDPAGAATAAALREAGVDCALAVDADRPTATIVVLVHPGGERTMLPDRGANLGLAVGDLDAVAFRRGDHLHVSGYALHHPSPRPAALAALRRARAAGMTSSVDPASAAPMAALGVEAFAAMVEGVEVLLPNRAEAALLAGTDDPVEATRLLGTRFQEVAATLGPDGALWSDGDVVVHRPALPLAVEDSTGAGDAFTAGFLAAHLAGALPGRALDAGIALAAQALAERRPS